MLDVIGVDADDTLWDEASLYERAEKRFVDQIAEWTCRRDIREQLRNLHVAMIPHVGYGAEGYRAAMLSLVQTILPTTLISNGEALIESCCDEITNGRLNPVPGVEDALSALSQTATLILITKGRHCTQLDKLERSGLSELFSEIHVVPEKTPQIYRDAFGAQSDRPHAAMIGNSIKSDILPALEIGALGIHIPFRTTSTLEQAEAPDHHPRYHRFSDLNAAAQWLTNIS